MAGILGRLARRAAGALFSSGRLIPQITRQEGDRTIVVQPEVVEPKGILRSKSVWSAILTLFFGVANAQGWNLFFSEEQAQQILGWLTAGSATAAGLFRVTATMPTRGPSM